MIRFRSADVVTTGLDQSKLGELEEHMRRAYLAGADDGPRSFAATAWVVRGIV